jgi:hypothetical protein
VGESITVASILALARKDCAEVLEQTASRAGSPKVIVNQMTILGSVRRRTGIAVGFCVFFLGLLGAATPCAADTIINTGAGADGPSVNAAQFEAQGWTQTQTYANVDISVALFSWTPGATFDITAYLTNAIGPSAAPPALDSTTFSGETPDSNAETFLLFSGLTLGPGTYYLTLSSSDSAGEEPGALWPTICGSGCPVALDSGVVLLSQSYSVNQSFGVQDLAYAPGSTFPPPSGPALNLTVVDDGLQDPSIPEPATFTEAVIAMAGLLIATRLRTRRV